MSHLVCYTRRMKIKNMKTYKVIYAHHEVIVKARTKEKARWYANMGSPWGSRKPLEVIEL